MCLDPVLAHAFVSYDLGPSRLQDLSADDTVATNELMVLVSEKTTNPMYDRKL